MNAALEFHDSDVEAIAGSGDSLRVVFSGAYVHRSTGRPGVDDGAGCVQPAEFIFSRASWSGSTTGGKLSDGELVVGGESMSLVPLPFSASGQVSVLLTFTSGATFSASAASVLCASTGESRFVETYAAG